MIDLRAYHEAIKSVPGITKERADAVARAWVRRFQIENERTFLYRVSTWRRRAGRRHRTERRNNYRARPQWSERPRSERLRRATIQHASRVANRKG